MLLLIIVTSSCKKDDYNLDNSGSFQNPTSLAQKEGQTILGEQLEDPYALKNMKQAYSNLKSANSETPDVDIQPTHTYIRFLPKMRKSGQY